MVPLMKRIITMLLLFFAATVFFPFASVVSAAQADFAQSAKSDAVEQQGAEQHAIEQLSVPAVNDPLERYNRWMFGVNRKLDDIALKPAAKWYRENTPDLVKTGVRNFFSNIDDVGVLANSALQGKFDQAMDDSARLTINTVVGLGGLFDVATMMDFEKNNEDFGQTFGHWGIPEGPYIVLPLLGPKTVRSATGTALDTWLQLEALGAAGDATLGTESLTELLAMRVLNEREKQLGKAELLEQAALDPYVFARDAYLAWRRCLVVDCDSIDYQPAEDEPTDNSQSLPGSDENQDEIDLLDQLD